MEQSIPRSLRRPPEGPAPHKGRRGSFLPTDQLLEFLKGLWRRKIMPSNWKVGNVPALCRRIPAPASTKLLTIIRNAELWRLD